MISAATTAAVSTTGIAPAAADEVSAEIASLFSQHGAEYQSLAAQAAAFHTDFTRQLNSAASAYATAEAAGASPLMAVVAGASKLAVFFPGGGGDGAAHCRQRRERV